MDNFLKKIFSEQFMDELAERVADKLAKKHLTNEKNILFQQKHSEKPTSNISSSYSSGCGSSNVIYDRCGNPKPYFNSGCGSGPAWRSEC